MAFAHVLGIRPWEHDLLTVEQFDAGVAFVDAYSKQQS